MSVPTHIRNLTRHSTIYTIATFIQRLQGLILLPILTDPSYLATKSQFGDYALIYTFIAFMNVVYLYGLDLAFLRYYFLGEHSRQTIYRSAAQFLTVSSVFLSGLFIIFAGPISQLIFNESGYAFFVRIAAGILFLDTLCNLPYLILRAEEKSKTYTIVRIGRFALELILNLFFIIYLQLGVKGILYANIGAAAINLVVLLPFQMRYLGGEFSWPAIKGLLRFGLPMVPNGIAFLIVEISDRYLMPRLLNKDILGEYTANYKLGTIMLLLVTAFRTAWQPFFLKLANDRQARDIFSRVMTYFIAAAGLVVLTTSLFIEYIVKIPLAPGVTLLGRPYWSGISIIPIILFSYLLYGIYVNLTVGIYIKKRSELMIIFTGLAAVVNVSSNLYLMPAIGMYGAAIATLLAYLVMMISIYIANNQLFPIQYDYIRIVPVLLYLVGGLILLYCYDLSVMIRILLVIGMIALLISLTIFRQDERLHLKNLIRTAGRL
jgi:O-antigen/teichoic acid export membrane protein